MSDKFEQSLPASARREYHLVYTKCPTVPELGVWIVLKEKLGNSTIISEKAKKRRIGERELKGLKFGERAIATRKR